MEEIQEVDINLNFKDKFKAILINRLQEGENIVCWSLPQDETIHLITSPGVRKLDEDYTLENLKSGFIIAPFNNRSEETLFIQSHFYWNSKQDLPSNIKLSSNNKRIITFGKGTEMNIAPQNYLSLVEDIVVGIEKGSFEKVVPARARTYDLPNDFDALDFFLTLTIQYPDAFVSWYYLQDKGCWIGASPEVLIEVKENMFRTVALAGTQPYESPHSIKDTSWTQKEIEEQALVSRYIINCFKKIRLREFEERGPKTVRAGNLLHLKTDFEVDMVATNYPDLGSIMLKLLHPTSAVCGMPLEASRNYLLANEKFDRRYYAGYLGPVNVNNETHIFVNLRCLQLIRGKAIAYAGAGVTIDSDPAKELNETEIKMSTLIRWLK